MLKRRDRLVNFRVTEDELSQLKLASDRQGARCLSDFAREASLASARLGLARRTAEGEPVMEHRLRGWDQRLSLLESRLSRLASALADPQAAEASEPEAASCGE